MKTFFSLSYPHTYILIETYLKLIVGIANLGINEHVKFLRSSRQNRSACCCGCPHSLYWGSAASCYLWTIGIPPLSRKNQAKVIGTRNMHTHKHVHMYFYIRSQCHLWWRRWASVRYGVVGGRGKTVASVIQRSSCKWCLIPVGWPEYVLWSSLPQL